MYADDVAGLKLEVGLFVAVGVGLRSGIAVGVDAGLGVRDNVDIGDGVSVCVNDLDGVRAGRSTFLDNGVAEGANVDDLVALPLHAEMGVHIPGSPHPDSWEAECKKMGVHAGLYLCDSASGGSLAVLGLFCHC